jgi:tetratricopeptide (TPR) repeat protein
MLRTNSLYALLLFSLAILPVQAEVLTAEAALATFESATNESDYQEALERFQSLHKDNQGDAELTFYLGRSLFRDQQLEAADEVLSANIKNHPNHVESHYVLGSVKLSRVGEVSVFKKIGMAKAAISSWEKAVEIDPSHVEALYGVVEFYLSAPGMVGGDAEFGEQKLLELEQLSEPWANLSRASKAMRAESFSKAEGFFASAIVGIPERAFPQLMLTNAYLRQEKFEQAQKALQNYRQRDRTWNDPGFLQIELMAGRIYNGLGQSEDAKASLDLVLSSNPPAAIRERAEKERANVK